MILLERIISRRKGLTSVVLEKSDGLRQTGAAIGVLHNGWRALDQLGVGAELRQKAVRIQGSVSVSLLLMFDRKGSIRPMN